MQIELHNVVCKEMNAENGFTFLYRFPKTLIPHLGYQTNQKGKQKALTSSGVEIRILTSSPVLTIDLLAVSESTFVMTYIGDFEYKRFFLPKDQVISVEIQHHDRMIRMDENKLPHRRFSSNMYRILAEGADTVGYKLKSDLFHETLSVFKPDTCICAYGSSITQGVGASSNMNSYLQTFANYANLEVLNKGMSGSCLCEKEMVDFLATVSCDAYLLELGCNMRGVMDQQEFQKRVTYLLQTLQQTNRPIFLIDMLSFFNRAYAHLEAEYKQISLDFSQILSDLSKQFPSVHLILSSDLLEDVTCISYDMLHPSEYGHQIMGRNLAKVIKQYLNH